MDHMDMSVASFLLLAAAQREGAFPKFQLPTLIVRSPINDRAPNFVPRPLLGRVGYVKLSRL